MRMKKTILVLSLLLAIAVALLGYIAFLYWSGSAANYVPPKQAYATSREQVQTDLQDIAKAVEAYFVVTMEYPRNLELLQPAFLERLKNDPASGTPYVYALSPANGAGHYRISVPQPELYGAKELYIEDGKLVQN